MWILFKHDVWDNTCETALSYQVHKVVCKFYQHMKYKYNCELIETEKEMYLLASF